MIRKIDKILPSLKKQTYLKYFLVNKLSIVCASIAFCNSTERGICIHQVISSYEFLRSAYMHTLKSVVMDHSKN